MACDTVELSRQNRKAGATLFAMNKITQTMLYRQSLIRYAEKYGVTKAAIRYNTNRQYIYRWLKRYDGTLQSLADRSHRPHSHPNQHTEAELNIATIRTMRNSMPYIPSIHSRTQIAARKRQRQYNNFPMGPLNWRSPKQILLMFPSV